jgi:hypothetical protein
MLSGNYCRQCSTKARNRGCKGRYNIVYLQILKDSVQKKFEVLFFEASRPVRDDMLVEKAKRLPSTVP